MFADEINQTLFAELLAIQISGFGDAIGEEHHAIAGFQGDGPEFELLPGENAQNAASNLEAMVRAVAMHNNGSVMSGVDVE